jgi:hypothetical protein
MTAPSKVNTRAETWGMEPEPQGTGVKILSLILFSPGA